MPAAATPSLLLLTLALAAPSARAQSAPPPADPPAPAPTSQGPASPPASPSPGPIPPRASDEPTAADVQGAPGPGADVSGLEGGQDGPPAILWVPRIALYPVRGALEVGMAPLRGLIYVEQKYAIRDRLVALFFNEDKTFGIFPTAGAEAGFGLNLGARMVWKEMFGTPMQLRVRGGYGGQFQNLIGANLRTPLGEHLFITATGLIEARPRDRFFGIGNSDPEPLSSVIMPIDPLTDPTAVSTRFSEDLVQAGARVDIALPRPFALASETYYIRRRFGEAQNAAFASGSGQPSIEEAYDVSRLPGFVEGVDYLYSELELSFDTRRAVTRFESDPIPGTGWYFELYGGVATSISDDETAFGRYGVDAQRYIRLAQNPRTLVLRAHVEGVIGDIEDIPFTELPRLGGPVLLRGYRRDRFRDRIRVLGTAEYQWDLSEKFSGFLFVDAGEVLREYADFRFDDMKVGFGGGLQMHTRTSYLGRVEIGTSTSGTFLFNFTFDPAFDIQSRTLRK